MHWTAVNEACVEFATRPSLSVLPATASRITSLQASTGGSILALAEGGDVLRLAPSTTAIASAERILDRVCVPACSVGLALKQTARGVRARSRQSKFRQHIFRRAMCRVELPNF